MLNFLNRIREEFEHAQAVSHRRASIRQILRESDHVLDDIGYSRPILEEMLLENSTQPFHAEAKRRSETSLRTPKFRLKPQLSVGSVSPKSAVACGGAC